MDFDLSVGIATPKPFGHYPAISAALMGGATLYCFRSGGGLRVVRIEHGISLLGYGEYPYCEQAFDYTDEDIAAGHRQYRDVYGGIYQHFLTGSSDPSSNVDRFVLMGRSFDIVCYDRRFCCRTEYIQKYHVPHEVCERVRKTGIEELYTSDRGFSYEVRHERFRGAGTGVSAKVIKAPDGANLYDGWFHKETIVLMGNTLDELLVKMETELPTESI